MSTTRFANNKRTITPRAEPSDPPIADGLTLLRLRG
jgi:hypothetical protein